MSISGWIKRTIYWTNDYMHGKKVRRFYEDLETVHESKEKGYPIQQKHLKDILAHAVTNSAFYSGAVSGGVSLELSSFPVVNKSILIANHDAVTVSIDKVPWQEGKPYFIQKTSGSTGTPFAVPMDIRKRNRRVAEIKYYNELVGFKSHEMLGQCRVWTNWHNKSKWEIFTENIIPINIAKMDEETTRSLITTIKENKIVALRAYASWYDTLVDYIDSHREALESLRTLKVCFSTSEALNVVTYERMKELTGVTIIEGYADEEAGIMAQKTFKSDGNFMLNQSGYVFEFLKLESDEPAAPGELSRIVITDLFNYAFPLIRYDTGDTAVYHEGTEASHGWEYISKLYGRRMDLVYDTKDQPVHPMNFARILKNLPGIIQYQFVQRDRNDYLIKLNITEECNVGELVRNVRAVLGDDANVSVEYVDEIPVLASGKRKPVVCEWKRDQGK